MNLKVYLVSLGICMCLESISAYRILGIFPIPGRSHYSMGEKLMRGLAERGHQVDVYNHFPSKKPIANFTDYNLDGLVETYHNNLSYSAARAFDGSSFMKEVVVSVSQSCRLLEAPIFRNLIDNPPNDPPYDLLIVEVFVPHCYMAFGRHLNVPVIGVLAGPFADWMYDPLGNPVNLATEPCLFSTVAPPFSFTERLTNFILSNYVKHLFNYYARVVQDEIVERLFGPDYPSVVDLPKDLALLLINHHHAIHGIRAFTPAVVPIGGLHIVDPPDQLAAEVQKFLDESKHGFVYISFGSMVKIESYPKPIVEVLYRTFENIKPVRVLMKIANPKELLPGLPSNVMTYKWLPQIKVLKHKNIKAFVTHGGLMGTLESIYYNVPMVGFSLFGDQHLNLGLYVKRNLAIQLDHTTLTEPILTKAIMEVINNPIYRKSTERVSKMLRDSPMSPMDTAAYWIEYIGRHGKDTLKSPLVDMPWWQSSLLDVYAFLIGGVLLALYVLKVLTKTLLSSIRPKRTASPKVKKN